MAEALDSEDPRVALRALVLAAEPEPRELVEPEEKRDPMEGVLAVDEATRAFLKANFLYREGEAVELESAARGAWSAATVVESSDVTR